MKDSYNYDDISAEFLDEICQSEEEILGKGKSKISLFDLSEMCIRDRLIPTNGSLHGPTP